MAISYNKLFKLLIDRRIKKTELAALAGFSGNTLAKLSKNEYVSLEVIVKICKVLNVKVDDIMDILPDEGQVE